MRVREIGGLTTGAVVFCWEYPKKTAFQGRVRRRPSFELIRLSHLFPFATLVVTVYHQHFSDMTSPEEEEKSQSSSKPVVHIHNYYGPVIQEHSHGHTGDTSLHGPPPPPEKKSRLPWLQYLYWIVGIVVAAIAIYEKWFKK